LIVKRCGSYSVAPRYTPGSPGLVDRRIAERVAREEARAYEEAITGADGEAETRKAKALGLCGVAEYREEVGSGKKHGWNVLDLCTGETFFRSTPEALLRLGWVDYHNLSPYERDVARDAGARRGLADVERGFFRRVAHTGSAGIEVYEATLVACPSRVAELSPWALRR
jgi:hypothetical protein